MKTRVLLLLSLACVACTKQDDEPSDDDTDTDTGALSCEEQDVATPLDLLHGQLSDGSGFLYNKDPQAKGVLVLFHGGGGSKEELVDNRVDVVLIAREAQARGFALAVLDSAKHVDPDADKYQWSKIMNIDSDAGEVNPDVVNTREMLLRLKDADDLAAVPSSAPNVFMGFSNGGSMASRAAQFLPTSVAVTYISNSVEFLPADSVRPPMVLVPGENDLDHHATESNADLAAEIDSAGGDVLLITNPPGPITPGLFMRVPGIDCDLSMDIRHALDDAGMLTDDLLVSNPKADPSWKSVLPEEASVMEEKIGDVLMEAYAEHTASSDWNQEVFEFVEAHLE